MSGATESGRVNNGLVVVGNPTDDEVAAIAAAVGAVIAASTVGDATSPEPHRWRFSGRWWQRPINARRERP